MQLSKITSKNVIIPAVMLAGSVAIANLTNHNDISSEATLEYMDKNPISQGTKAGILAIFWLGRTKKRKENEAVPEEKQNIIDIKEKWKETHNKLRDFADDLCFEPEIGKQTIDNLISKLENESKIKEASEFAIKGLKFIKDNFEYIVAPDLGGSATFNNGRDLYDAICLTTQAALYPELIEQNAMERGIPKWIKLGNSYMEEFNMGMRK